MNNKNECCCFIVGEKKGNTVSKHKAPFLREDLRIFKMKASHKLHLLFTLILFLVNTDNAETRAGEESEAYRVGTC